MGILEELDKQKPKGILAGIDSVQAAPAGPSPNAVQAGYKLLGSMGMVPPAEQLPTIGGGLLGTAGGMLGGGTPLSASLAVMGATMGGTLGSLGEQALTPGLDVSRNTALGQGATQGVLEGTGLAGAKVIGAAARPLMGRALRPTAKMLESAGAKLTAAAVRLGQKGLPKDLVEAALLEGAKIGRGGSKAMARARQQAAAETQALYQQATNQGIRYNAADLLRSHLADVWNEFRLAGDKPGMQALRRLARNFADLNSQPITPVKLKRIVQIMQKRAAPVLNAINRSEPVTGMQQASARFSAAVAKAGREMLDQIPGAAEREASTQRRIIVEQAVRRAENLPPPAIRPGLLQGAAYNVGTLGGLLDDPMLASRLALMASNPFLAQMLRQTPRVIGSAGAAINGPPEAGR